MIAKRPVSVGGICFDALVSQDTSYSATVPQYACESGYSVSDGILLEPEEINMTLYVSATPVTWNGTWFVPNFNRPSSLVRQLEALYMKAEPITVITTERTYENLAISSFTVSKTTEQGYAREIPITFKQIYYTYTATVELPKEEADNEAPQEDNAEEEDHEGSTLTGFFDLFN